LFRPSREEERMNQNMKSVKLHVLHGCLVVSFVLFPIISKAQFFVPVTDDPFAVPIRFSPDSVRNHKIHTITSAYQYKPDGRIIEDRGLREYFEFDRLGRLTYYWRTRVRGMEARPIEHPATVRRGKVVKQAWTEYKYAYAYDTAFIYTFYDSLSRISTRRYCEGIYYHTWYYTYNEQNFVVNQIHTRETNTGPSHRDFKLGVQTVISREDFSYEVYSSTLIKQNCLNDVGKTYKETMMTLDKQGRLIESREAYTAGGIRIITTYAYDELGRMASWTYSSNAGEPLLEQTQYVYDSLGRIESVKRFKNTVLKDEFSYLYDGTAKMSYAYINRRHIELGIDIIKMQIEFY
jgi:YD repeat-containing protein